MSEEYASEHLACRGVGVLKDLCLGAIRDVEFVVDGHRHAEEAIALHWEQVRRPRGPARSGREGDNARHRGDVAKRPAGETMPENVSSIVAKM
jgi:hypothetical protein